MSPSPKVLTTVVLSSLLAAGCATPETTVDQAATLTAAPTPAATTVSARDALFSAGSRFEYPDIVSQLEEALAAAPNDAETRLALVYGYLKIGEYDKARAQVNQTQGRRDRLDQRGRLWLDAFETRINDEPRREIDAWQRVVDVSPDDRWAHYEHAVSLANVENYAGAAAAATRALRIEPDPREWEASWIYYLQSKSLARSGQHQAAVASAAAARGSATTWRSTFFRMALAQIAAGDTALSDTVADDYRRISSIDGRNNLSYTEANIALFFYELGDYERAVDHARRAYDLDPKGYQAWALSYNLTEMGRAEEGLEIIEKAAVEFPDDAHVLAARGWTLFRLGRMEEARQSLIAAQANSERKVFYIDRMRKTIETALGGGEADVDAPWLG